MRHVYSVIIIALLIWIGITLNRIEWEMVNNWKNPNLFVGTLDCPVYADGTIIINEKIGEVSNGK